MEKYFYKFFLLKRNARNWRKVCLLSLVSIFSCINSYAAGYGSLGSRGTSGIDDNYETTSTKNNASDLQKRPISGTVRDDEGKPLSGVTVKVKDSNNGTTTDSKGEFSLDVPDSSTLIVSYVGYETKEISVLSRDNFDIILSPINSKLNEVIVIGYGTQKKSDVTGAISTIDMKKMEGLPDANIDQAFNGVAGVQIKTTGRPGESGSILIRGQNSLSSSTTPLIVLDGIIFNGNLADINPNDIQSIDVLKDASATAIYGSRAANGVILITSKKGKTMDPTFTFNASAGLSDAGSWIKLLSPERYLQRRLDWRQQSGMEANPSDISKYLSPTEAENLQANNSQNALDLISQQGTINSYNLSVAGRSANTNYYLSGSVTDNNGLILDDNSKRVTARANIEQTLNDWLKVGINATFSHLNLSGLAADINDAYRSSPYGTYLNDDGTPTRYPAPNEQAATNPLWNSYFTTNDEIHDNLFSNIYVNMDFPFMEGLSYRMNYSPNYRWNHDYSFLRQDPHWPDNVTNGSKSHINEFDWSFENIVKYNKVIGDNNFDLTLLFSRNGRKTESTSADGEQFLLDLLGYNNLGLASIFTNSSSAQVVNDISYMARLNYIYKGKYLVTATARRDGSSVFANNNKYATFPSVALGWILSKESFLKNNNWIDNLKIRASYGAVGNQAIAPYQSLSLSDLERYVYGDGGAGSVGVVTSTMGNHNLKWETTKTMDFALDFGFFKNRLSGTIDYYHKSTENLLVSRSIPAMDGYLSILDNIGQVNNSGIDISLNTINIQTKNFKWSTEVSFNYNKNTIVHLYNSDVNGDGTEDDDVANSWFIDHPINSYFDYAFDGIYQQGDKDIPSGSEPGFVRFKDLNGDGVINTADRTIVGSGVNPDFIIGLANTFTYKNWSLRVFLNSMKGWIAPFDLINPLVPGRSLNQFDGGWWTEDNKSNSRPSLVYANPLDANWYVSRDFVRIKSVVLGYSFNGLKIRKIDLSSLRLNFSVENLYTFTNWLGSDPENGTGYTDNQGSSDLYPMPRTFLLSASISF